MWRTLQEIFWPWDELFTSILKLKSKWGDRIMSYGCFSKLSPPWPHIDQERLSTTIQTDCRSLLKYTLHTTVDTVLYLCTVSYCTDQQRLTNPDMSPSLNMKIDRSVLYCICDCSHDIDFFPPLIKLQWWLPTNKIENNHSVLSSFQIKWPEPKFMYYKYITQDSVYIVYRMNYS
jgi:hypothetical protein